MFKRAWKANKEDVIIFKYGVFIGWKHETFLDGLYVTVLQMFSAGTGTYEATKSTTCVKFAKTERLINSEWHHDVLFVGLELGMQSSMQQANIANRDPSVFIETIIALKCWKLMNSTLNIK